MSQRQLTDAELKELVIDLLTWLGGKGISTRDAIALCGFSMTALVLTRPNPDELSEQVIDTFRESVQEHLRNRPTPPHPRPPRRIH